MMLRYILTIMATIMSCTAVVCFVAGELLVGTVLAIVAACTYMNVVDRHKDTLLTNVICVHTDLIASVSLFLYFLYDKEWLLALVVGVFAFIEVQNLKKHYKN